MDRKKKLRIVFGGTPDFAAEHLKALINEEQNVIAVYTQPDRQSGRGHKLTASPVKEVALQHNIPVEQPLNFRQTADVDIFRKYAPDLFIVVAYGIILPREILEIPTFGCINVHGSLLPKYRGAAPIQRAIFNGDSETGVTVMQMNEGLDTGDIILKSTCSIDPSDTSETLFNKLIPVGCKALSEVVSQIASGTARNCPQDENYATYAAKISKEEAVIDWNLSAQEIDRRIRTYVPWPTAKIHINDLVIKVHQATVIPEDSGKTPGTVISADHSGIHVATGNGTLILEMLQMPGKKIMKASDILNGYSSLFTAGRSLL